MIARKKGTISVLDNFNVADSIDMVDVQFFYPALGKGCECVVLDLP